MANFAQFLAKMGKMGIFFKKALGKFLSHLQGWWSKKISTGPQLSEYVWVVCRNTKGTCLKSVSKTPNFRFFCHFLPGGGCVEGHTNFLLFSSFQNMYRLFAEIRMELA